MSSSCGVETSTISVSSSARTRCTVPGRKAEASPGADHLRVEHRRRRARRARARRAPRSTYHDSSLTLVELERQRLRRRARRGASRSTVGERPDQLPAPGLLDPRRGSKRRALSSATRSGHSRTPLAGARRRCSSARRSSFGVFTVSHMPSCRYAAQPALGGELREGRRLVVAPLGEALDRLVAEARRRRS